MKTDAENFLTLHGLPSSECFGYTLNLNLHAFMVRDQYIEKFGFAIPNKTALSTIAAQSPILEVGAGSGYWAHELQKLGADIIATDSGTGRYRMNGKARKWVSAWCPVIKLDAVKAIHTYPDRALLTVWPDYHCDWPVKALTAFHGNKVFYVGEGYSGCTGNDAFHQYLDNHFELTSEVSIPQFPGMHDRLFCYQRKKEEK